MKQLQTQELASATGGIMKRKRFVLAAAALLFALSTTDDLMATVQSRQSIPEFGNDFAGVAGTFGVVTEYYDRYSRLDLTVTGLVKFLTASVKGVEYKATSENFGGGVKRALYKLSLAGFTVDSGTEVESYSWETSVPVTLVRASTTVPVGPIPVTISGSVGGRAGLDYTLSLGSTYAGISGNGTVWVGGSASAGIGVDGFEVGLRSDLRLLNTALSSTVRVSPTTKSGLVELLYNPLSIDLVAFVKFAFVDAWEYVLASSSRVSKKITLLAF